MKHAILILVILSSVACSRGEMRRMAAESDLYVSKDNFLEFPFYKETDELDALPTEAKCSSEECNEFSFSDGVYYKAILLDYQNGAEYLVGRWSGGDCINDQWSVSANGEFSSHYPLDSGMYKWSGKYFFKGKIYIEDGTDGDGGKEWNEAYLYYVPANGMLIYKGIRSFESFNKDGSMNYTNYKGPDFYYFRRCDKPL